MRQSINVEALFPEHLKGVLNDIAPIILENIPSMVHHKAKSVYE